MKRILVLVVLAAGCGVAADLTGRWSGSYYAGPIYLVLKQTGSTITGTAGPSAGQQMLKFEGQVEGDRVTLKAGPIQMDVRLDGDDLKGELTDPGETSPVTLTRVEALGRRAAAPTAATPFEIATIKPNKTGGINTVTGRGGQIRPSKGQIAMENVTLFKALGFAYRIGEDKDYAITGPDWLKTERYDIVGKIPPGTTFEQMLGMLQATLAQRFKMSVHHETKELPIYAMVPARGGVKLQEVDVVHGAFRMGPGAIKADGIALAAFADRLSQVLDRPVIDMTGLAGIFTFSLEFAPDRPLTAPGDESASPTAPSLFTAMQQQLGLRLEARRGPVEVLVVDRADRVPIEN